MGIHPNMVKPLLSETSEEIRRTSRTLNTENAQGLGYKDMHNGDTIIETCGETQTVWGWDEGELASLSRV